MSDVAVFYTNTLCIYVPVIPEFYPENSNFKLYSGNINQECVLPLGNLSDYRVFLGLLTWKSGTPWVGIGTFLIQVFKVNTQILGATGNFSSDTNEIYLTNYFGDSLGSTKLIPNPDIGDISRLITITNNIIIDEVIYNCQFSYECIISPNIPKFNFNIRNIKLLIDLQSNNHVVSRSVSLLKSVNKKLTDSNISVFIDTQTDKLGLNLGEMYCRLTSNKFSPNGYPQKYIGKCIVYEIPKNTPIKNTFYSFKPNLSKVLKFNGEVLFEQTKKINSVFKTGLTDCKFYFNILVYSTLRYIFAGLSNNSIFSIKWLYSNKYEKFLENLENSEFSAAVPLFTEPQPKFDFSNFNRYYRKCKCQK